MASSWRIELFGGLRVFSGKRSVSFLQAPKAGLLLAYLAYFPRQPQTRELFLEMLWPESDPESSRHNLRSLLHALRRQLGPADPAAEPLLLAEPAALCLNPAAFSTDVAEFTAALERAARSVELSERARRLAEAVALYRGELLAGFYDPWVLTERQRLGEEYLSALQHLVLALEESGDLEQAIEYARRAVQADPLREEAHYDLMRLYAAAGQPSATLRQYQELERLLREELDETPSAAARALAEELRQNARTVVVARSLGGREREGGGPGLDLPAAGELAPGIGAAGPHPADRSVIAHQEEIAEPPATVPGPASVPQGPPVQFTRLFGREEEIARVTERLCIPGTRLVTLTGPGGSGKTRLAIAVAGRLQARLAVGTAAATDPAGSGEEAPARSGASPDEIWFVSLAEVHEARRIGDAVREAMGLPPEAIGGSLEQVITALSTRSAATQPGGPQSGCMLFLDNFEHLVDEGAPYVRRLLERVPSLKLLITSRRRLGLEGEQELVVLPLPTARASDFGSPQTLISYPSVQLFVDRALAARPEFRLTEANAGAVAKLCDRLEGLPLAIELAAGRAAVLSPEQMLARLAEGGARSTLADGGGRFELLVSRRRDVSARHRSLRAVMEGSYQSLAPELQRFFARLSVFRGGWPLEAAEAVCAESALRAVEDLQYLRQSSLIVAEEAPGTGAMRYRMLETLREFAAEQQGPEEQQELARKHARYFLRLAEQAKAESSGAAQTSWLARLETEHDNMRAALEWCQTTGDLTLGLALGAALGWFWHTRGHLNEGRERLATLMGKVEESGREPVEATTRAQVLLYAGRLTHLQGDFESARPLLHEGLSLARSAGDAELTATCLGEVAVLEPDLRVKRTLYEESLTIYRELGDEAGVASVLVSLGMIDTSWHDLVRARALYQEGLTILRQLGDKSRIAWALIHLGLLSFHQGDYTALRAHAEESLALFQAAGDRMGIAASLHQLGTMALVEGEPQAAAELYSQALQIAHELGSQLDIARNLASLGEVALVQGDRHTAAVRCEQALAIFRAHDYRRNIIRTLLRLGQVAEHEGQRERAAALYAEALAGAREEENLLSLLAGLEGVARVAAACGEEERGVRLLGSAAAHRAALGAPLPPYLRRANEEALAAALAALGEAAFAAAWAAGQVLPLKEAVVVALGEE
jgi:predicted ATPase/DNA-binding SARP family transcriptional activator